MPYKVTLCQEGYCQDCLIYLDRTQHMVLPDATYIEIFYRLMQLYKKKDILVAT